MNKDKEQILTVSEINRNFTKATEIADKKGSVIISKNNKPRYMLIDIRQNPVLELTDDEKIEIVAKRILEKYRRAFEELAQ